MTLAEIVANDKWERCFEIAAPVAFTLNFAIFVWFQNSPVATEMA